MLGMAIEEVVSEGMGVEVMGGIINIIVGGTEMRGSTPRTLTTTGLSMATTATARAMSGRMGTLAQTVTPAPTAIPRPMAMRGLMDTRTIMRSGGMLGSIILTIHTEMSVET